MPANKVINTWDSVTLIADELWQIKSHIGESVILDTEATESDRVGIDIYNDQTIQFTAGLTVYFKKKHSFPASIHRIALT